MNAIKIAWKWSIIHKNECNKNNMNVNVNSTKMIAQGAGQEHVAELYRQYEVRADRRNSSSSSHDLFITY